MNLRRKKNKRSALLFITVMFIYTIQGQTVGKTNWSLMDCIDYAMENNILINQSKMRVLSVDADLLQARGRRLPNLSGSASQFLSNSRKYDDHSEPSGWQSIYGGSVSLSSSLVLYQGSRITNNIRKNEVNKDVAFLNVKQAEMDITLSVVQSYLNILYAHENLEYYREVLNTSIKQLDRTRAMQEAGSLSRRDIADMEAQLATHRYMLVLAKNSLQTRTTELKQQLEIPVENVFNITFPEKLPDAFEPIPDRYYVYEQVLETRPEMKNIYLQKEITQLEISEARSGYLPTLTLNLSAGTDYNNKFSSRYGSQMSDNMMQYAGVSFAIPIFSRFENKASVSRAVINDQITELSIQNTRNKLLQLAESIYEDTQAGYERYLAAIIQEKASVESFSLAQEQYNIGMLSTVELLHIRSQFLNSRSELIQARYTALLYKKILEYYMGIPVSL